MSDREFIRARRSLLPDLNRLQQELRNPTEEVLERALPARRAALEAGLEGAEAPGSVTALRDSPASVPEEHLVQTALEAQRRALVEQGFRAAEKIEAQGDEAELSPSEAMGLEAIIELYGRPAILIQDGHFFPPPPDWEVLEGARDPIETALKSVGRVEVSGHPSLEWIGTGFLVAPDVLMTNRHVALELTAPRGDGRWGIAPGMQPRVDFHEELGATEGLEFQIRSLIGIHGQFDMALFRVAARGGRNGDAQLPPPLPLAKRPSSGTGETRVYAIGYPAWDGRRNDPEPMQRIFNNIFNVKRLQPGYLTNLLPTEGLFTHDCSTLGGNSGSCVLDLETHAVLGLHFGGRYREANRAVALWQLGNDPLLRRAGVV